MENSKIVFRKRVQYRHQFIFLRMKLNPRIRRLATSEVSLLCATSEIEDWCKELGILIVDCSFSIVCWLTTNENPRRILCVSETVVLLESLCRTNENPLSRCFCYRLPLGMTP